MYSSWSVKGCKIFLTFTPEFVCLESLGSSGVVVEVGMVTVVVGCVVDIVVVGVVVTIGFVVAIVVVLVVVVPVAAVVVVVIVVVTTVRFRRFHYH